MIVHLAKMAAQIDTLFGLWTWADARNHVLDGSTDRQCKQAILRGKSGGPL